MQHILDLAGERFLVREEGSGTPVLLVHGFPFDHHLWDAQVEALAAEHRVVVPDLRGFGGSVVSDGTVTMARMAGDLAAVLDALDVDEPLVCVGFSMGGYVGWHLAARHAARMAALVAVDTRAAPDTPQGAAERRVMAARVLAEGVAPLVDAMLPKLLAPERQRSDPALVATVRAAMLAADPRGVAAALLGMAERPDARTLLPRLDLPVLAIVGEHDAISPPDEMATLARSVPHGHLFLVPGAGHLTPLEAPDAVNEALGEFLAALR